MMLPTDGTILLNAGTMSPTPRPVFEAGVRIRDEQASNPHLFFFQKQGEYVAKGRAALAGYLRVRENDLFLIPNVTIALNLAIHAIEAAVRERRLTRNKVLVSSVEYGSIALTWRNASALTIEVVPVHECKTWDEIVEAFAKRIDSQTVALCISHISQPNGRVMPVKALCALAREKGVLSVIDGAHVPGMLPLELQSIGADAYGANVHKWMMGLANSGFLHVSPAMKDLLRPLLVSWGSKDLRENNRDTFAPFYGGTQLQGAVEFWGCVDRVPQMVLGETVAFLKELGEERMHAEMKRRSDQLKRTMLPMISAEGWDDPEHAVALTAFRLECEDRAEVRDYFWKHQVAIGMTRLREDVEGSAREVKSPADRAVFVRVSTAWYTQEHEVARFCQLFEDWLKRGKSR